RLRRRARQAGDPPRPRAPGPGVRPVQGARRPQDPAHRPGPPGDRLGGDRRRRGGPVRSGVGRRGRRDPPRAPGDRPPAPRRRGRRGVGDGRRPDRCRDGGHPARDRHAGDPRLVQRVERHRRLGRPRRRGRPARRRRAARHRARGGDRRGGGERARLPRGDQPGAPGSAGRVEAHHGGMALVSRGYRVGVIPGDGTGPEVVREGLKVLEAVREGFDVELVAFDLGAERYLRTGEVLPDEDLETMRGLDAIFLGAVGDPRVRPGILERELLLRIRFELDQYVNLRPVVRYLVVRENSEGLYTGAGGFHRKGTPHEVAVQESINTRRGVERIVRYAFELARAPGRRGKVTLVHKTNVLTFAGDLYQRVVDEVAREYPAVETDYVHVDAACIYFLDQPSRFDVIVTDNM